MKKKATTTKKTAAKKKSAVKKPRKKGTVEVYRDAGAKWRWRVRATNGKITEVPGEDFDSRFNCLRAANAKVRREPGLVLKVLLG